MSSYLWKVQVIKQGQGGVAKGMNVEIVVNNSTRQPTTNEISDALNKKYHIDSHFSTINNWIQITKG